jgi:hypothetical protein
MTQNALDRIWNRFVDRYSDDADGDCCGPMVEEVETDAAACDLDGCDS